MEQGQRSDTDKLKADPAASLSFSVSPTTLFFSPFFTYSLFPSLTSLSLSLVVPPTPLFLFTSQWTGTTAKLL